MKLMCSGSVGCLSLGTDTNGIIGMQQRYDEQMAACCSVSFLFYGDSGHSANANKNTFDEGI
jgi:hypothetical protein